MKALSIFVGLILLAQVAFAKQNVFTYHKPFVIAQSHSGLICPKLSSVTAVNEINSFRGRAVHILDARGVSGVYVYESTTQKCRKDIICESFNHYSSTSTRTKVKMMINNDGAFPTTDLPGYKMLKLMWVDGNTSSLKYCHYYLR